MKIVMLDNLFPYRASAFRFLEYRAMLRHWPEAKVLTSLGALGWFGPGIDSRSVMADFRANEPDLADRVIWVGDGLTATPDLLAAVEGADLLYSVFLDNTRALREISEATGVPFAFTLYPGGGFRTSREALMELRNVLRHPGLAGMITTQPYTVEILRRHFPLLSRRVPQQYVFGVVADADVGGGTSIGMRRSDAPIQVCFVGYKYAADGGDKGFDIYLEVARRTLDARGDAVAFHCIGPWTEEDLGELTGRIHLHGVLGGSSLAARLGQMDIGLYPTRSRHLGLGAFDGFPVGSAVELALKGGAVITTNPLGQRTPLTAGSAYLEIDPTVSSAQHALDSLLDDLERLECLRETARAEFGRVYSATYQLEPRFAFLERIAMSNPRHSGGAARRGRRALPSKR